MGQVLPVCRGAGPAARFRGPNLAREREQQHHFRLGGHNLIRQSGMHRQQLFRRERGRGPFRAGLQPEPAFEQVQGKDARLNVRIQRSPRALASPSGGYVRKVLPVPGPAAHRIISGLRGNCVNLPPVRTRTFVSGCL